MTIIEGKIREYFCNMDTNVNSELLCILSLELNLSLSLSLSLVQVVLIFIELPCGIYCHCQVAYGGH